MDVHMGVNQDSNSHPPPDYHIQLDGLLRAGELFYLDDSYYRDISEGVLKKQVADLLGPEYSWDVTDDTEDYAYKDDSAHLTLQR